MTILIQDKPFFANAKKFEYTQGTFKVFGTDTGHTFEVMQTVAGNGDFSRIAILKANGVEFRCEAEFILTKEYYDAFLKMYKSKSLIKVECGSFNYQCVLTTEGLTLGLANTLVFKVA
jgi:hypothetical protein